MRRIAKASPVLGILGAALLALGCEGPPSDAQAREWTAADHDRVEEQARVAAGQRPGQVPQTASSGGKSNDDALVAATWRTQCAQCHGLEGRGDGPTGPMVNATDFSSPAFQSQRTDAELVLSIENGKGKMPKFDLPDGVVRGLVARIRMLRGG